MCEPEMRDECRVRLDKLDEHVREIRKAVLGNGRQADSLVSQVARHGLGLKIIGAAVVAIAVILPGIIIALAKFLGAIGN